MEANEGVKRHQAVVAFFLGIASLVAIFVSLLALTDIYRGIWGQVLQYDFS